MKFAQLTVLLPCQTLESLALDRSPEESDQLLSAWTGLFHPVLVASADNIPEWGRAEEPSHETHGALVVIPPCCDAMLPEGWLPHAESTAARVVRNFRYREEVVSRSLETLGDGVPSVNPQLVADFFALGFCHFLAELLTRQLRYMSNLDAESFKRRVVAAAQAAVQGDESAARDELHSAFDLLTEAREYFYPVETHLLDLTLVASSTVGESLRAELSAGGPINLLMSASVLDELARREPATLAMLKEGLEKGTVNLIGGEFDEQELPLLPPEAILEQFERGLAVYDAQLGRRPAIFGRRRFGLWPVLPQVLRRFGFEGALHFTLDDGRFPTGNQSKIRWEGLDGSVVESLVRVPLNANQPDVFLGLPKRLGDTMDLDHAATLVFAHWPDQVCPWYRDLRRTAAYSPVLGKFSLMGDYFQSTQLVGKLTQHKADEYRVPYLRQNVAAGQPDPISRWTRYYARRLALDSLRNLTCLADLIGGAGSEAGNYGSLASLIEEARTNPSADHGELNSRLADELERMLDRFAAFLPRSGQGVQTGYLTANPFSFARQSLVEMPELAGLPAVGGPVRAAQQVDASRQILVETPSMGFAWIGADAAATPRPAAPKRSKKEEPPLAEENLLRNEFFEVKISRSTGGIQGIHEYQVRGNRLGQQVAMRLTPSTMVRGDVWDETSQGHEYSVMSADEITVTSPGPLLGEIVSRGRLLDREGQRIAGFRQTMQVRRGSRVIEIRLDLDIGRQPDPDPWNSYYAMRFAWSDETTDLYRSVNLVSRPSDASFLESPYFLDLRTPKARTTILTGGLPYHRRFGLRMLDTLLVVQGETAKSFRLGIGIGLVHAVPAALDFLAPRTLLSEEATPASRFGWLFHLDAKNVLATHWSPLLLDGRIAGYRVRLLETEGRNTRVGLRSFQAVKSARRTEVDSDRSPDLSVEDDRVAVDVGAYEWVQVEVEFVD